MPPEDSDILKAPVIVLGTFPDPVEFSLRPQEDPQLLSVAFNICTGGSSDMDPGLVQRAVRTGPAGAAVGRGRRGGEVILSHAQLALLSMEGGIYRWPQGTQPSCLVATSSNRVSVRCERCKDLPGARGLLGIWTCPAPRAAAFGWEGVWGAGELPEAGMLGRSTSKVLFRAWRRISPPCGLSSGLPAGWAPNPLKSFCTWDVCSYMSSSRLWSRSPG